MTWKPTPQTIAQNIKTTRFAPSVVWKDPSGKDVKQKQKHA